MGTPTKRTGPARPSKKEGKGVTHGVACIQATFNNTFVTITDGTGNVVVVPKAAVLADAGRTFVFVHHQGEFWVRRPVTLGRRSGDMVEGAEDLAPSQRIIADGSFILKSDVLRGKMGAGCAD